MHVGVAGLGLMGSAIAQRLIEVGHRVSVWNRTSGKAKPLVDAGASLAATPAALASAAEAIVTILTDATGMTLYMFTKDEPSLSNCYDQCAVNWPPLMTDGVLTGPDAAVGGLGTTTRQDGGLQVTYNGMPLYYWINDHKPGDTTGQNVGGVWFVVNP